MGVLCSEGSNIEGYPGLCGDNGRRKPMCFLRVCLRRAVVMSLEGIPVASMGCKGVQKGDKEIRSITESR